jgi:hypothetical protein
MLECISSFVQTSIPDVNGSTLEQDEEATTMVEPTALWLLSAKEM